MNAPNMIELTATAVWYYSANDEQAFFAWLDRIACVDGYRGIGRELLINVDLGRADEEAIRELLAIFFRYGIDMQQLAVFGDDANNGWFRAQGSYWYDRVFGQRNPGA